ncbi:NHLP leader peptide family RiPP precursor [Chryseobacterium sp. Leaf201]|uniref:NHLP leader peptide family RiPP precursor n=1 Tax=Chryseobacterium sp. Leaf201 TaxID=1735672 RepID=UPI0009E9491E|nr:NHLP leader peptide family RiPP precursor [Chryseobacterium sp. Leaf201]
MEFTQEQNVYAEIVQKAWEDAEFKKALLANPVEAIEKLTGKKMNLPEGKTFVVRDQTDESIVFINLPPQQNADVELNEDQLEAVAGGVWAGPDGSGCTPTFPPKPTSPFPKDIFTTTI